MTEVKILIGSSTKKIVYMSWMGLFLLLAIGLLIFEGNPGGLILIFFCIIPLALLIYEHSKKVYIKVDSKSLVVIESILYYFNESTQIDLVDIKKVVAKKFKKVVRGGGLGGSNPITYQAGIDNVSSESFSHGILLVVKNRKRNIIIGKGMSEEDTKNIKHLLDDKRKQVLK